MQQHVYSLLNDNVVAGGVQESLDVHSGCNVIWTPFTAGDALPTSAVEGGYLQNGGSRHPLYVMSVLKGGCHVYGYYNPAAGLGYVEFQGKYTPTQMDLMVLMDI